MEPVITRHFIPDFQHNLLIEWHTLAPRMRELVMKNSGTLCAGDSSPVYTAEDALLLCKLTDAFLDSAQHTNTDQLLENLLLADEALRSAIELDALTWMHDYMDTHLQEHFLRASRDPDQWKDTWIQDSETYYGFHGESHYDFMVNLALYAVRMASHSYTRDSDIIYMEAVEKMVNDPDQLSGIRIAHHFQDDLFTEAQIADGTDNILKTAWAISRFQLRNLKDIRIASLAESVDTGFGDLVDKWILNAEAMQTEIQSEFLKRHPREYAILESKHEHKQTPRTVR